MRNVTDVVESRQRQSQQAGRGGWDDARFQALVKKYLQRAKPLLAIW